ncbi:hypothetical protein [Desulfosporosinus sp. BICA1-9]|uniref:hypothetical protein n=1 Tax=Desulfosporosinus sp. BICA1-9 TaxID=1531958 RepID=UPI000AE4B0B3|nr:hypothetical protein [Desulfosporosinus sp. BICA1-9]
MGSKKFTIDDIHQIRYKNYENTKSLKPEELIEKTKCEAEESKKLIEELRKKTSKVSCH